jgi:hypothetical protein
VRVPVSPSELGGRARVKRPNARADRRTVKVLASSMVVAAAAMVFGAPSHAEIPLGNYEFHIQGRYDFHTWVWTFIAPQPDTCPPGCVQVSATPRPVARAYEWQTNAQLVNGQYTLSVDDPTGLRCGDVYYGPVIQTHDIYTWDAITQTGVINSTFDTNCGGAPGGTYTYPFTLARM